MSWFMSWLILFTIICSGYIAPSDSVLSLLNIFHKLWNSVPLQNTISSCRSHRSKYYFISMNILPDWLCNESRDIIHTFSELVVSSSKLSWKTQTLRSAIWQPNTHYRRLTSKTPVTTSPSSITICYHMIANSLCDVCDSRGCVRSLNNMAVITKKTSRCCQLYFIELS